MEVAQSNRSNISGGTKSLKRDSRPLGTSGKGNKKKAQQRSFLTTKFNSIPIFDVSSEKRSCFNIEDGEHLILGGHAIEIEKNLEHLRKCAEAYCKVHGGHVPSKSNHPLRELQMLYSAVAGCCPKDNIIEINYDEEMNRLVFIELAYATYPDCSLAFFSVCFLDLLPPEYREFFLQVLSLARVTFGIPFPEDHFDFAYATGYFDEEYIRNEMDDDPEYSKFVDSYISGKARKLFDEIYHTPWNELENYTSETLANIKRLIYDAPSDELSKFVEVAYEGVELMSKRNIMRFRYNEGQCNIGEFDSVYEDMDVFSFDRIVAFCYGDSDDDPVVESAIAGINSEAGNLLQEELYDPCMITPEYSSPFIPSDFPQRFFDWYIKFSEAQTKYEQTFKNDVGNVQSQDGDHCI